MTGSARVRAFALEALEWRRSGNAVDHVVTGHIDIRGVSDDLGGFVEVWEPGAWRAALAGAVDLRIEVSAGVFATVELHEEGEGRPRFAKTEHAQRLFVSSVGTPLCADWLSRRIRRYLAAAGITTKGSCHLLRHTVATLLLEGGADIRYVAEMLGHARLETTQRYTRVSIDRFRLVHASCHPAAGVNVATASEICAALPHTALNTR